MQTLTKTQLPGKKISEAMADKALAGGWPGQAPLGYCNVWNGQKRVIAVDLRRAPLIQRAFLLAEQPGTSLRLILADLTEQGLVSKRGKPLSVSAMWHILTDPFYVGRFQYRGELLQGTHQPLITQASFDRVQANLSKRRRRM